MVYWKFSGIFSWNIFWNIFWNIWLQKKDTELNNETRSSLYQNEVLNDDTRGKGCSAVSKYLDKLKDITMDLRGDIKDKCADEKGVEDLMNLKVVSFRKLHSKDGVSNNSSSL